jgi:hypothetical protein
MFECTLRVYDDVGNLHYSADYDDDTPINCLVDAVLDGILSGKDFTVARETNVDSIFKLYWLGSRDDIPNLRMIVESDTTIRQHVTSVLNSKLK